jgi:hypothetical protein
MLEKDKKKKWPGKFFLSINIWENPEGLEKNLIWKLSISKSNLGYLQICAYKHMFINRHEPASHLNW